MDRPAIAEKSLQFKPGADVALLNAMLNTIIEEGLVDRQYIEKNTDNVGKNFSEEARKIYYGETKSRPIRGETTKKEAQELAEEGIPFSQLPWQSKEDA